MPDPKYYVLTAADRQILDELALERRRKVEQTRYDPPVVPLPQTPDFLVARTPSDGIPALTERTGPDSFDEPGYATCMIYKVIRDTPEANPHLERWVDQEQVVYNISRERIGGNRWAHVTRDKDGRWHALPPHPFPSEDDPTGAPTDYGPGFTGTGTGGLGGGVVSLPFPPSPSACAPVYIDEVDLFCDPAPVHVGTGTGTDVDLTLNFLNLYKRRVYLGFDLLTGCLQKVTGAWQYVRTVGCCDTTCFEPATGTGPADPLEPDCCARGVTIPEVGYSISGKLGYSCAECTIEGTLTNSGEEWEWTNGPTPVVGCSGRTFVLVTLYCSGTHWRARGTIRQYVPFILDRTITFDEPLSPFVASLNGTITIPGCSTPVLLSIGNPCISYNCVDGECVQVIGDGGTYETLADCLADCEEGTIATDCCANLLPATLTLTFSAGGGDCSCLNGESYEIVYDEGTGRWRNTTGSACGGNAFTAIEVYCTLGAWAISLAGCINHLESLTEVSCEPLILTKTFTVLSGTCCTAGNDVTVTVTL